MEALGFSLQAEANLQNLTMDVVKSGEIEGEILDPNQVWSSIARRLGLQIAGMVTSDRHVDGVVEMLADATQHNKQNPNGRKIIRLARCLISYRQKRYV